MAIVATAWGAAGSRDRSFGKDGFTVINEPSAINEFFGDVLVLKSGKILAAGGVGGSRGFLLGRFKANGRPDRKFGPRGLRIQPFDDLPNRPRSLRGLDFDSRGRIVAAGLASGPGPGNNAFGFARYLADGARDTSFGNGGVRVVQPTPFGDAFDVAAAPGDRVVAVGQADGALSAAIRLTPAGNRDGSFGPGGVRTFHVPGSTFDSAGAVLPLRTGSLLVGGLSDLGGFVVKLGSGGLPAAGFASGGFSVHDFGEDADPSGEVNDIALARGGKILLTGEAESGVESDHELFVARLKANGGLDPSFASGGILRLNPTKLDDVGLALARRRDGKVVIAGIRGRNTWLLRLTPSGRLDRSFGTKGQVVANAALGIDGATSLALDGKGRAVIAGQAAGAGGGQLLLGRFLGDPRRH